MQLFGMQYYSESVWCNHMDSPSQYFRFLFYHVSRHCSCQYPTTPSSWNKTILQTHKSHMYHGHNSCFLQFHHFAPELSRQLEPFWPLAVSTPNFYSLKNQSTEAGTVRWGCCCRLLQILSSSSSKRQSEQIFLILQQIILYQASLNQSGKQTDTAGIHFLLNFHAFLNFNFNWPRYHPQVILTNKIMGSIQAYSLFFSKKNHTEKEKDFCSNK